MIKCSGTQHFLNFKNDGTFYLIVNMDVYWFEAQIIFHDTVKKVYADPSKNYSRLHWEYLLIKNMKNNTPFSTW